MFDSGRYEELLDQTLVRFEWNKLEADVKKRRAAGEIETMLPSISFFFGREVPDCLVRDVAKSR